MKKVLKVLGIIVALILIIVVGEIVLNKIYKTSYSKLDETDKKMFSDLSKVYDSFRNSSDKLWDENYRFDKEPLLLTRTWKDKGIYRKYSYVLNVDNAKNMLNAKEIEMPKELNLPKVYRIDRFAPGTAELWMPFNFGTVKLDNKEVFYFKYYPKMMTNPKLYFDFSSFMLHESFHTYKQANWTYDEHGATHIENFPKDVENYGLMGVEFKILDKILESDDKKIVKEALEELTIVRGYRYNKWPQLYGETKAEAIEGSARYIEYRYSNLIGGKLKVLATPNEPYSITFEQAFNFITNKQAPASFMERDSRYETGATIEFGMDKIGIDWKPMIEDSNKKHGKTQYDILKDYFNMDSRNDLNKKLEEIKLKYNYEELKNLSAKII